MECCIIAASLHIVPVERMSGSGLHLFGAAWHSRHGGWHNVAQPMALVTLVTSSWNLVNIWYYDVLCHKMHTIIYNMFTIYAYNMTICHSIATASTAIFDYPWLWLCCAGLRLRRRLHLHCPSKHRPAKESFMLLGSFGCQVAPSLNFSDDVCGLHSGMTNSEPAFCRAFVFSSAQRPKSSQLCTVHNGVPQSKRQSMSQPSCFISLTVMLLRPGLKPRNFHVP